MNAEVLILATSAGLFVIGAAGSIRMIHDRWIDKYTEPRVSALLALKAELEKKDKPS